MNFYNDNDPRICDWLRELIAARLIPNGVVDGRSITDLKAEELRGYKQIHFFTGIGGWAKALELAGWPEDKPIITASLPCQPWSVAGQQRGAADERNLWAVFYRLVQELQPEHIVGEQVEAAIGLGWLDGISTDLESQGYTVGAVVLPACSVGAPHRRYRIFWVATRNGHGHSAEPAGDELAKSSQPGFEMESHYKHEQGEDGIRQANLTGDASRGGYQRDCELGDANNKQFNGRERIQQFANGSYWSDYDLCNFTDGKIRRIGSRFKWMVNGLSNTMVPLRDQSVEETQKEINAKTSTTGPAELLPPMSVKAISETLPERRHRSDLELPKEEILQSNLHGPVDGGKNQSVKHQEQPSSISEDRSEGVPAVRTNSNTSLRSSHRRESNEQPTFQLEDLVRLVSQAVPLAVLEGDSETCEKMLSLFPSCWKARPVPGSLSTYAEEWRPPPMEEVERAWKADYFKDFRTWPRSPLKVGQEARSWRLKAYGNSIAPQLASEFIKAYMETIP